MRGEYVVPAAVSECVAPISPLVQTATIFSPDLSHTSHGDVAERPEYVESIIDPGDSTFLYSRNSTSVVDVDYVVITNTFQISPYRAGQIDIFQTRKGDGEGKGVADSVDNE